MTKEHASRAFRRALDAVEDIAGGLRIRVFDLAERRSSARLDALTWEALRDIAAGEGVTFGQLAQAIDRRRPRGLSLTVALRCYALSYFRSPGRRTGASRESANLLIAKPDV